MKRIRIVVLTVACAIAIPAVPQASAPQSKGPQPGALGLGAAVYAKRCAICHGTDREGSLPAFPPLQGITHRYSNDQLTTLIHTGKGRMPGFPKLQGDDLTTLLAFLSAPSAAPATAVASGSKESPEATAGEALFHQNCAFCHGRDAMGGETGPDLTQSKLVLADKEGDKITPVVREGRPDSKMPGFNFSTSEMSSLVAFIHARARAAATSQGGRRGVTPEDLQTGDAEAGKAYFNGAGGCSTCHSPTGDLAGIARRLSGLTLEKRMLYPEGARSQVTVTTPSGQTLSGVLAYQDEFTIGMRDSSGAYRSWPTRTVKYTVKSPAEAHAEQLPRYSDDDIHNLMKYLQTLR